MSSNYPVVNTLSWSVHVEAVCAQIQELLNVLWRLGGPGIINTNILLWLYRTMDDICFWYGVTSPDWNLTVHDKSQFLRITRTSSKIVGWTLSPSLLKILKQTLIWQARKFWSDAVCVLSSKQQLQMLRNTEMQPESGQVLFHYTLGQRPKAAKGDKTLKKVKKSETKLTAGVLKKKKWKNKSNTQN